MKRPAYYIGRCPGCVKIVAACVVNQGHLDRAADAVHEFICDGLTVEPLFEGPVEMVGCACESEAQS